MIKRMVKYLFGLIIILLICVLLLFYTAPGVNLLYAMAKPYLPSQLSIGSIEGNNINNLHISDLHYQDEYIGVSVEQLDVSWQIWQLLFAKLNIKALNSDGLTVKLLQAKQDSEKQTVLPLAIKLNQATIENIHIQSYQFEDDLDIQQLTLAAQLAQHHGIIWNMDIQAKQLVWQQHGNMDFHITSSGHWQQHQLDGSLNIEYMTGTMADQAISGQGSINLENKTLSIDQFQLIMADAILKANGTVQDQWNIDWHIDIPDLSIFFNAAQGSINSQGQVKGPRLTPSIHGDAIMSKLQYADNHIAKLNAQVNLDVASDSQSSIILHGEDIQIPQIQVDEIDLSIKGDQQQQQYDLKLVKDDNKMNVSAHGIIQDKTWNGILNTLSLQSKQYGDWKLSQDAPLTISKQILKTQGLCLNSHLGTACFTGVWQQDQGWYVSIDSDDLDLNYAAFIPPQFSLDNKANLHVFIKDINNEFSADAQLKLTAGTVSTVIDEQPFSYQLENAMVNASMDQQGLIADASIKFANIPAITANLQLPDIGIKDPIKSDQSIKANAKLYFSNLSFVAAFFPLIRDTTGKLDVDLAVAGTIGNPNIQANASLKDGSFTIPRIGAGLRDIQLTMQSTNGKTIDYKGSAATDKGALKLSGETDISNFSFDTKINVSGEDVEVIDTRELMMLASPNIDITIKDKLITIDGKVFIPKARIAPKDFTTTVTLSDDVQFVTPDTEQVQDPYTVHTNVAIDLGKDVRLNVFGLRSKLVGHLDLRDRPNTGTIAFGQLSTKDGTVTAYGRTLAIETGQLLYTGGPVGNPGLNIRAEQQAKQLSSSTSRGDSSTISASNITVGVAITGTLHQPLIELYSNPAGLSQSEILSYLLLSKPVSSASAGDQQLLLGAMSALNLGGSQLGMINEQMEHTLGLDELNITSGEAYDPETKSIVENTSLVLGKSLSPKLFLSYSLGLIEPINILSISYQVNSKVTVETEAGADYGGLDVFYTIERD